MSTTLAAPAVEEKASLQDWIAVVAGALGALIASLDISIVNSALPTIQGEIGASGTEGTWISTGYLVSEVVMIPLSAWLSRVFGLRSLLLGCAVLFTFFSMICGVAHDLPTMILGRVGQGFFGGALIPTAQTIVRTRLPPRQMPIGMTIFGLIVLLGPLVGPVLGGWLTENVDWRWCFFLNVPDLRRPRGPAPLGPAAPALAHRRDRQRRLAGHRRHDRGPLLPDRGAGGGPARALVREPRDRDPDGLFMVIGFVLLAVAQMTAKRPVINLQADAEPKLRQRDPDRGGDRHRALRHPVRAAAVPDADLWLQC